MILVHRLNGKEFYVNCELIKYVEATPDTVITLLAYGEDEKIMVKESVKEVLDATLHYKKEIHSWKSQQS